MSKIIISFILALLASQAYAQTINTTTTIKSTATLASVCTISAQNVNFGVINLPVNTQTATSSMNIQCTKGSAFTIGLAYGGIYGLGASSSTQVLRAVYSTQQSTNLYNCWYNPTGTGYDSWVYAGQFSGYCPATYTKTVTTSAYNYGLMNGVSKGDSVAYAIQVPNNPSQVWNAGEYNYTSTGTGLSQSIPIVTTLVPAQTNNKYPAPDSYTDVVTATINY